MNCTTFHKRYDAYAVDELSAGVAQDFEEHASQCQACGDWLEMQQAIGEALRESADSRLPPHHYFEGVFQRIAPRLTRVSRWTRMRQAAVLPFEALFLSNGMFARTVRMVAICLLGVGIGWALGGHRMLASYLNPSTGKIGSRAEAASAAEQQMAEAKRLLQGAARVLSDSIVPRMPEANDQLSQPVAEQNQQLAKVLQEKQVFEQIDLVKFQIIREGNLHQLPPVLKIENDLLSVVQIQSASTWTLRHQCSLVQRALSSATGGDARAAEAFLAEAMRTSPQTRWACLAQYLLATLKDENGDSRQAATLWRGCLEQFPADYLTAAQSAYARSRIEAIQ